MATIEFNERKWKKTVDQFSVNDGLQNGIGSMTSSTESLVSSSYSVSSKLARGELATSLSHLHSPGSAVGPQLSNPSVDEEIEQLLLRSTAMSPSTSTRHGQQQQQQQQHQQQRPQPRQNHDSESLEQFLRWTKGASSDSKIDALVALNSQTIKDSRSSSAQQILDRFSTTLQADQSSPELSRTASASNITKKHLAAVTKKQYVPADIKTARIKFPSVENGSNRIKK